MFSIYTDSIFDVFRGKKTEVKMEVFGDGSVKLSKTNIIYLEQVDGWVRKCMTFSHFRKHIYFYSEYMTTACVELLDDIETSACVNARSNKLAKQNLLV